MIAPGQLLYGWPAPRCLECGCESKNIFPHTSAFICYACSNLECDMRWIEVTVEKASNVVFSVGHQTWYNGKPAFPSELVDREGNVVWRAPVNTKEVSS